MRELTRQQLRKAAALQGLAVPRLRRGGLGQRPGHRRRGAAERGGSPDDGIQALPRAVPDGGAAEYRRGLRRV